MSLTFGNPAWPDDGIGHLIFKDVRATIPARIDDDLGVRKVGNGIQSEMAHGIKTGRGPHDHKEKNQEAVFAHSSIILLIISASVSIVAPRGLPGTVLGCEETGSFGASPDGGPPPCPACSGLPIPDRADFSLLSESIRKFPEVTIFSPRCKPLRTVYRISHLGSQLDLARFKITISKGYEDDLLGAESSTALPEWQVCRP